MLQLPLCATWLKGTARPTLPSILDADVTIFLRGNVALLDFLIWYEYISFTFQLPYFPHLHRFEEIHVVLNA